MELRRVAGVGFHSPEAPFDVFPRRLYQFAPLGCIVIGVEWARLLHPDDVSLVGCEHMVCFTTMGAERIAVMAHLQAPPLKIATILWTTICQHQRSQIGRAKESDRHCTLTTRT